jgi:hypothetical protein
VTLGAALLDAAQNLAPQIGGGSLILDLQVRVADSAPGNCSAVSIVDQIWLTESSVGGGGFVEDFLKEYVKDPRRYFRLLEDSLAALDLEAVSEEVGRVLEIVGFDGPDGVSIATAFRDIRDSESHAENVIALNTLRSELSRNHIQPTPTLLIALGTRVLRPGTNP